MICSQPYHDRRILFLKVEQLEISAERKQRKYFFSMMTHAQPNEICIRAAPLEMHVSLKIHILN